jgi:superfamily II DNA or RNA helicase
MILRPYQVEPVALLAKRKRAMVIAPAGSGKTIIAAAALEKVLLAVKRSRTVKIGWLANTQEQCQQAKDAIGLFKTIAKLGSVKIHCAAADVSWADRDVLIVDESHHSSAPTWKAQIESCQGARWGFTATPESENFDAAERNRLLIELFAPECEWIRVDRGDVGDSLSKARVTWLDVDVPGLKAEIDSEINSLFYSRVRYWKGSSGELKAMIAWQKCIELGIVKNEARTATGISYARFHVDRGDSTLVLVNQVEHGQRVADAVPGAVACYSGMGAKARRHALYDFKAGKLKCIVATSLADEGLDIPIASALVLMSGGKNKAKAEQRTGRVLRAFAGKTEAAIYDFADTFHPLMKKHADARRKVYEDLGYARGEPKT